MNRLLLTIILGAIAGILGGTLGFGGSFIMMPGLLLFGILKDYKHAVGTTLFTLLPPISLFAVIEYYKRKEIDIEVGTILILSYIIFAYFGSLLNPYFTNKYLEYSSGFIFLICSLYFFKRGYNDKN